MSQTFNLQLATDTLLSDAQQLGVSCEQLQQIRIEVSATVVQQPQPELWLTYRIQLQLPSLAVQLSWPALDQQQAKFIDYLWEQTCLECFIDSGFTNDSGSVNNGDSINQHESTSYIEINASPNGHYAVYKFDDYRNPSTLPPTPLYQADGQTLSHINWQAPLLAVKKQYLSAPKPVTSSTSIPQYYYERSFGISLDQIPSRLYAGSDSNIKTTHDGLIKRLHPCVILWFGTVDLYFAPNHATPPDFHQRHYWPRFNYLAALVK